MSKNIQELSDETLSQVTGGKYKLVDKIFVANTCEELQKKCYEEKTGSSDMSKPLNECDINYDRCKHDKMRPVI